MKLIVDESDYKTLPQIEKKPQIDSVKNVNRKLLNSSSKFLMTDNSRVKYESENF